MPIDKFAPAEKVLRKKSEAKDIARDIRNEIKDIKESLSEKDSGNDTHEKEEPENIQKTTAEKD